MGPDVAPRMPLPCLGDPGADQGAGGKMGRAENDGGGGGDGEKGEASARPTISPWVSEDERSYQWSR